MAQQLLAYHRLQSRHRRRNRRDQHLGCRGGLKRLIHIPAGKGNEPERRHLAEGGQGKSQRHQRRDLIDCVGFLTLWIKRRRQFLAQVLNQHRQGNQQIGAAGGEHQRPTHGAPQGEGSQRRQRQNSGRT